MADALFSIFFGITTKKKLTKNTNIARNPVKITHTFQLSRYYLNSKFIYIYVGLCD